MCACSRCACACVCTCVVCVLRERERACRVRVGKKVCARAHSLDCCDCGEVRLEGAAAGSSWGIGFLCVHARVGANA